MSDAPGPTQNKPPGAPSADPESLPAAKRSGIETSVLRFLVDSAEDLNSSLELDTVFEKVADRIRSVVDTQLFCVMLWNEDTRLLEHSFSLCFGEQVDLEGGFALGTGISGTCAAERRPIRVADVRCHESYVRHRHPEVEIRSEMAVPLILKERLIGVIDLESTEPNAFTQEHEQMLTALASHVAIAVENARLYERVKTQERMLHQDVTTAREIQKSLLSRSRPHLDRLDIGTSYLPVNDLGGDFYDFLPLSDDRLAFAVGDVAGKGTPAALYGSLAVGMLRGHVLRDPVRPAKMLQRLNAQLHLPRVDNRFVAMVYGMFDSRDLTLALANGGFTRPMLLRKGRLERLQVRGVPLGLLLGVSYDEIEVSMQSGDIVAFVSDGLQEAIDGQGQQFGDRFLSDVLEALSTVSAQQIADGLIRASTAFAGDDEQNADDRSVVILKIR
jgi:sigma-B regulation protein RsbU (phosphoserine phosphatase)